MVDCIVYGRTETCSAVVFKVKPLGVCAFAPNGGEGGLEVEGMHGVDEVDQAGEWIWWEGGGGEQMSGQVKGQAGWLCE